MAKPGTFAKSGPGSAPGSAPVPSSANGADPHRAGSDARVGLPGVVEGSREASWAHFRSRSEFAGFDVYEAHAPGLSGQLVLGGTGAFTARVRRVRGEGLLAVVARTSLSNTVRAMTPDREVFAFTEETHQPFAVNGMAYPHGQMLWIPASTEIFCRDPGEVTAWSYSFDRRDFETAFHALNGRERKDRRIPQLLSPPPGLLARLHLALSTAMDGAGAIPRSLVTTIIQGTVAMLPEDTVRRELLSRARRFGIVDGLIAFADRGGHATVTDVCAGLGVPFRTLNASANTVLGMSAGQYLRRRRLHAARDALRAGLATSVTEAAMSHSFWELGRFAGDYHALFGEQPSATLRRAVPPRQRTR